MLTAMEYQRAERTEKRRKKKKRGKGKSSIEIVRSISMVDANESPKTWWEVFAGFVLRWRAPGLKTIGKLLPSSQP